MIVVVAEDRLVVVAALKNVVRLVGQDEAGLAGHGGSKTGDDTLHSSAAQATCPRLIFGAPFFDGTLSPIIYARLKPADRL